jgi:hypothetical protein
VGSEHIERFIPVAEAQNERSLTMEATAAAPATSAITATREMPKFLGAKRMAPAAGTAQVARTERKAAAPAKAPARAANKQPATLGSSAKAAPPVKPAAKPSPKATSAATSERDGLSAAAREQVIADAARLVQWGRKWFELPELIARMADRPSLPEVRRILKENKSAIDGKARGA